MVDSTKKGALAYRITKNSVSLSKNFNLKNLLFRRLASHSSNLKFRRDSLSFDERRSAGSAN